MKDVNRMFALCTPEWMVEDGETKAEENAIVLAIIENLRTCLKGFWFGFASTTPCCGKAE